MGKTQIIAEPGTPQIVMTREFDAPAELLFRAYTEPDLLSQWLGPRRLTMANHRFDVRHGGTWSYVHRDTDGTEYGFRGVFHGTPSVEAGIVQTFEWEGLPGRISFTTVTFEAVGARTRVRTNDIHQSVEDRDGCMQSGMISGVNEGNERLNELLARLVPVS